MRTTRATLATRMRVTGNIGVAPLLHLLSVYQSLSLSIALSLSLSLALSNYLYLCLSVYLSASLSACLSISLSYNKKQKKN